MSSAYIDKYGIIDETRCAVGRYPRRVMALGELGGRRVDDTAPTLKDALVTAGRMLVGGSDEVSICTTRKGYEVYILITLTSHEDLESHDLET